MAVDHINTYFGHFLVFPGWFHWLGRFVAPVFLYLLMEGFKHSKNRKKYLTRLFIASMVMHAINIIHGIITKSYYNPLTKQFEFLQLIMGHNIFWTLFLMLSMFILLDKARTISKVWIIPVIGLLPFILFSEGGMYLLPIALACFFFDNDPKKVSLAILAWCTILFVNTMITYFTSVQGIGTLYQHLTYSSDFLMATSIPFILMYNGLRGGSGAKWEKNLFYIFYPAHFVIIYIIAMFLPQ